ncbi:hypothetical protein SAMN06295879_1309 [Agreia bicolorata]|uniref:DUF4188 domain-containing protein n=1 Tax=Agreia bicolorata TaxID=110935 RepID=A0A1T4XLF3_9MICO|nr:hypothetical protein [Agreia bicolorata]SKA90390.1 hypothetical protein SAMN06295879_1309 [Agreia bicolorata]
MRSTDFSLAPPQGRAGAMVVVERRFETAMDARRARSARRDLAAHFADSPGFLWQKSYRRPPRTLGIASYFSTRDKLDHALVTAPSHVEPWLRLGGAHPTGRVLEAEPSGYTNGIWRAEDGRMGHIERFTPTSVEAAREAEPPRVDAASTERPTGRGPKKPRQAKREPRPISDAHAMFVGATKYTGPTALIALARIYYPMIAHMVTMRGYVWFTTYYEFPFTLGTLAFFERRDDLLAFARMPGHRHLMQWITKDTTNGTAGYIRLHVAPESVTRLAAAPDATRPGS